MNSYTEYLSTPIGILRIHAGPLGLKEVKKVDQLPEGAVLPEFPQSEAARQLQEYFEGERDQFAVTLDFSEHQPFYKSVWEVLRRIPYGQTTSYLSIAEELGDPKSVRAVGQANRNNPWAIIVPCHRVIAKNGDLQGYFYGLETKRQLLALENPKQFAEQGKLF